jgi:IS30 family transposase
LALTLPEREVISRGIVAGRSIRSMAGLLGRSPSTVSREVRRNGGYDRYRAVTADERAWARARRPKRCKLADSRWLRRAVSRKLRLNWSPEQISGWLKRGHPGDGCYQVSHETIYRSLFVQARGVLRKELLFHLRSKRTIRRSKQASQKGGAQGQIKDMISIRERPASVEDRAVPGHWEGDLLSGSKNSYIATLVERHTRYVMLAKVGNKDTQTVVSALVKQARKLPTELYKSLTWDRGKELADHRRFSLATDIDVYFCDPQSPWQRGSNENTNGLLRQYFPKGVCRQHLWGELTVPANFDGTYTAAGTTRKYPAKPPPRHNSAAMISPRLVGVSSSINAAGAVAEPSSWAERSGLAGWDIGYALDRHMTTSPNLISGSLLLAP